MIGAEVTYSEMYKQVTQVANPGRKGIIKGENKDKTIWKVLWNGRTKIQYIHKSFITIIHKF